MLRHQRLQVLQGRPQLSRTRRLMGKVREKRKISFHDYFNSNDSSNSRSSYESGFYNNLSRSNSPLGNEPQELGSPNYENRSLSDLMVNLQLSRIPTLNLFNFLRTFSTWINRRNHSSSNKKLSTVNKSNKLISILRPRSSSCRHSRRSRFSSNNSSCSSN